MPGSRGAEDESGFRRGAASFRQLGRVNCVRMPQNSCTELHKLEHSCTADVLGAMVYHYRRSMWCLRQHWAFVCTLGLGLRFGS